MPVPARVVISHQTAQDFRLDGLRPYAEYRDFGFAQASHGAITAHVLRFVPGYNAGVAGKRHIHDVDFQMVYLFRGWISYEFESVGPITMQPGDAWTQPPGIRHTVTGYSDDCELMELVMPVEYDTIDVDPAGTTPDETTPIAHLLRRRAALQRIVVSHPNGATTTLRDFGFGPATGGMVEARELRFDQSVPAMASSVPAGSIRLGYLLEGAIDVRFDHGTPIAMHAGCCWLEPPDTHRTISVGAERGAMFEVIAKLPT
jgi:quercetin dioxygenase-like cupin family protein